MSLNFDDYKGAVPFVPRSKDPAGYEAYQADQEEKHQQFKRDLLADLGLTNHPKADLLFSMAWESGHASGYREVYLEADRLADLLR